jgi:hypothetical protein
MIDNVMFTCLDKIKISKRKIDFFNMKKSSLFNEAMNSIQHAVFRNQIGKKNAVVSKLEKENQIEMNRALYFKNKFNTDKLNVC